MTRWSGGPGEVNIPHSTCSDNCPLGHVRNFQVSQFALFNFDIKINYQIFYSI